MKVVVVPEDLPHAKAALLTANAAAGLAEVEEAWVVRSLCRADGWSQAEVARKVSRGTSPLGEPDTGATASSGPGRGWGPMGKRRPTGQGRL